MKWRSALRRSWDSYPKRTPLGWKKIVSRGENPWNVQFNSETSGWNNPFRVGPTKSALANLPEDEVRFPVATWVKQVLSEGVQRITLSSESMRRPSPPGRARAFLPDGSNMPWVAHTLERSHPDRFADWLDHVREALPDLDGISTREREEDRHRYLVLRYKNGLEAPSWLVSDGTLRLLALTLPPASRSGGIDIELELRLALRLGDIGVPRVACKSADRRVSNQG